MDIGDWLVAALSGLVARPALGFNLIDAITASAQGFGAHGPPVKPAAFATATAHTDPLAPIRGFAYTHAVCGPWANFSPFNVAIPKSILPPGSMRSSSALAVSKLICTDGSLA